MTRTRDGRIAIELHHPRPSGATHVLFDELGLVKKLAALVYPPGLHRARYFGVLSSASKHRPFVVPTPPVILRLPHLAARPGAQLPPSSPLGARARFTSTRAQRGSWVAPLLKTYGVDARQCTKCHSALRGRIAGD